MAILQDLKSKTKADLGPVEKRKTRFVDTLYGELRRHPRRFFDTILAFNFLNLSFLLAIPLTYIWQILSFNRPKEHIWNDVFRWIFKNTLFISGITVAVEQSQNLPLKQTVVLCPNHTSYLDGPTVDLVVKAFGIQGTSIVAPIPYFPFPFSFWLRKIGGIDVVRDKEEREKYHQVARPQQAIAKAAKSLQKGECVLIFPEGHLEKDHHLTYFHTGAMRIALKAKKDIVPITIIGASEALPPKKFLLKPGKIRVIFHKPINLEKYYGMDDDHTLVRRLTWELEKDIIENLPKSFIPDSILDRLPEYLKEKRRWQ